MRSNGEPQSEEQSDHNYLFISAILLLAVGLAAEGIGTTSLRQFIEGMLIGMSIACSLIGFIVYIRSPKK